MSPTTFNGFFLTLQDELQGKLYHVTPALTAIPNFRLIQYCIGNMGNYKFQFDTKYMDIFRGVLDAGVVDKGGKKLNHCFVQVGRLSFA